MADPTIESIIAVYGGTPAEAQARLDSFNAAQAFAAAAMAEAEAQSRAYLEARAAGASDPTLSNLWSHETQSYTGYDYDPYYQGFVNQNTGQVIVPEPPPPPPPPPPTYYAPPPTVTPTPVKKTPADVYNEAIRNGESQGDAIIKMNAAIIASEYERAGYTPTQVEQVRKDITQQLKDTEKLSTENEARIQAYMAEQAAKNSVVATPPPVGGYVDKYGIMVFNTPEERDYYDQTGYYKSAEQLAKEAADREAVAAIQKQQAAAAAQAAEQQAIHDAVTKAIQNGFTKEEIREIAEQLKIDESKINYAFEQVVGSKTDAEIIKGVSALATANGITYENIVKYADTNKLPYADVASALKSTFKDTTADEILNSMVYEKDRQQFSALAKPVLDANGNPTVDAKGNPVTTVNLGDAIAESIKQGIAPENLAKFYGKTDAEFKSLVNANLSQVANTLRGAGIDAHQGLTDLLGIDRTKTQSALIDYDVSTNLQSLQKDGLTYKEILDLAQQNNIPVGDFVNKYLSGDATQKTNLISALNTEAKYTSEEQSWREAYRGLQAAPTMQEVLKFQKDQNLSDEDMARIFGDVTGLKTSDIDKAKVSNQLAALQEDGTLSLNEILGVAGEKQMSITDFVNQYLGGTEQQKTDAIAALSKEAEFAPQERAWREAYSSIKDPINIKQASDFQTANNLSDADMERIFNIPAKSLDTYRITTAIQGYSGEDKQLSYSELAQFAKDNNMDLSNVVDYIGTEESRPEILKNLQNYVKDEEFKSGLSNVQLTDYTGKQYSAADLFKLSQQVKQNFDLENSSGGAYKTQGANIGFAYDEAQKLMPEGKTATTVDQIALDIARNLLNQGISDVNDLAKYKPTQVIESTPSQEGGGNIENVVTKYIDPATGQEAPTLGATYAGEGGTGYAYQIDSSGKPVFSTNTINTSDRAQIGMLASVAAAFLAPQLLPNLIGSSVAGIELAALGGEMAAGTGLTGALMSAGVRSNGWLCSNGNC